MKAGYQKAKEATDGVVLETARNYRSMLIPPEIFPIIKYRTARGDDYGVLVNKGEKVVIWNAFSERLETMGIAEYNRRFIGEV